MSEQIKGGLFGLPMGAALREGEKVSWTDPTTGVHYVGQLGFGGVFGCGPNTTPSANEKRTAQPLASEKASC